MKKALTKALAIFLAALLLPGAVPASAAPGKPQAPRAASPTDDESIQGTLEIIDPGKAQMTFDSCGYWDEPDLSGLVLKASGGKLAAPQTVKYDEAVTEEARKPKAGKIVWYFGVAHDPEAEAGGFTEGENKALLCAAGYQYSAFIPTKVIGGVQYGRFEEEPVFYGEAPVTVTVLRDWAAVLQSDIVELALDVPVRVKAEPCLWFRFAPAETGYYRFESDGAEYDEILWTEDGEYRYDTGLDPYAELYDENGKYLAGDDDGGIDGNFLVHHTLQAGKTYYLRVTSSYREGEYTVTVRKTDQRPPSVFSKIFRAIWHVISGEWYFGEAYHWLQNIARLLLNIPLLIFALLALPARFFGIL